MTLNAAPVFTDQPDATTVAPLPAPKLITPEVAAELQSQPAANHAVIAAPPPAFTPRFPMADGKRTEFLFHVASTIRDYVSMGKTEADAVPALREAQEALAKALDPKGDVAKAAALALTKAMNDQLTHEGCHLPQSEQDKAIEGIFIKRQAEAQHAFMLLSDAGFMKDASQLADSGKPLNPPHWFDAAKQEETIAELVTDAPAHTIAAALGAHMLHKALASVWKIDGPLQAPLSKALKSAIPEASPEAVIGLSKSWLHDRFHRADTIAGEVKPGSGSLYLQAMERTIASIHTPAPTAPLKEAAAAVVAAATPETPAVVAAAPLQHEGAVVQHVQPELTPAI